MVNLYHDGDDEYEGDNCHDDDDDDDGDNDDDDDQVTRTDEDAARELEELTGAEAGVNGFVLHMAARFSKDHGFDDEGDECYHQHCSYKNHHHHHHSNHHHFHPGTR